MATYWDFQLGVRHDFQPLPNRTWAVFGFQGLAPYLFEIDAAFFVGDSGRTAFRFEAEFQLLLTQRPILTPEIDVNLYGKTADIARANGEGASDTQFTVRLRA